MMYPTQRAREETSPSSNSEQYSGSRRHSQAQQQPFRPRSRDATTNTEDIWGPFERFGFDSHALEFADSTVLRGPDGNFYRYERIDPATAHMPFRPRPPVPGPSLMSTTPQWSGSSFRGDPSPEFHRRNHWSSAQGYQYQPPGAVASSPRLPTQIDPPFTADIQRSYQNPSYGARRDEHGVTSVVHSDRNAPRTAHDEHSGSRAYPSPHLPPLHTAYTAAPGFDHSSPNGTRNGKPFDAPTNVYPHDSSATTAQASNFFTTSSRTDTHVVATPSSSPPSLDSLQISDDAAAHAPIHVDTNGSSAGSDRISGGDVTPGEVLVYEGDVRRSSSFRSPFELARLRIFRHTMTDELRFYTRVVATHGNETQSFKMRLQDVELVPTYAYDVSKGNALYLRENKQTRSGVTSDYSGIFDFLTLKDLLDFQGKLLEEEVSLDISSLRFVTLVERGDSRRRVDFARVQMWHGRPPGSGRSDTGSIMTSGTQLSGPLKERVSPEIARLVVFLGRAEEFLTIFITDDITIKADGPLAINLQPTKYSGIDYLKSRSGIKCRQFTRSTAAAGIPLSKKGMDPDDEESYSQLRGIKFEFEDDRSLHSFCETWNILMRLRRKQRLSINSIQSDMSRRVYYGRIATKIL